MSKNSTKVKLNKKPKFKVQGKNICSLCGRTRGYMRLFGLCRLCFREMCLRGELPGVVKASW